MSQYIKLLSDISLMAGLIGHFEYFERYEIADWLDDSYDHLPDPRKPSHDNEEQPPECDNPDNIVDKDQVSGTGKSGSDAAPWLELLMINQWMFTIGDADCYPSVPHGHFKSKDRKWPKLNPYTGRVFSDMHKEDSGKRLSKKDMKKLWNTPAFVEHCREQVLWYSGFAPSYDFPRARRGTLVFPRWR